MRLGLCLDFVCVDRTLENLARMFGKSVHSLSPSVTFVFEAIRPLRDYFLSCFDTLCSMERKSLPFGQGALIVSFDLPEPGVEVYSHHLLLATFIINITSKA